MQLDLSSDRILQHLEEGGLLGDDVRDAVHLLFEFDGVLGDEGLLEGGDTGDLDERVVVVRCGALCSQGWVGGFGIARPSVASAGTAATATTATTSSIPYRCLVMGCVFIIPITLHAKFQ